MAKFCVLKLLLIVICSLLLTSQSSIKAPLLNISNSQHHVHHDEAAYQYSHHVQWSCFKNTSTEAINCCQLLVSGPIACLESDHRYSKDTVPHTITTQTFCLSQGVNCVTSIISLILKDIFPSQYPSLNSMTTCVVH